MHLPFFSKGQGATEYILLVGAALLMAMVVVSLLGTFFGPSNDARRAQSAVYWGTQSWPFAISDSQEPASGNLTLVLQNRDSDARTITTISIASANINSSNVTVVNASFTPNSSVNLFQPGQNQTIVVPISLGPTAIDATHPGCTAGKNYEYYVNITYSNADFSLPGQKQVGAKTLVGVCQ